jgi:pilus assembly protein Flp/PilA
MEDVMKKIIDFFKNEEGATVPEYALMLAVIAAVVLVAVQTIGTNANATFTTVGNSLGAAS